jgi:hypothetical protein
MTVIPVSQSRRRMDPVAAHVYTVPVVRPLPAPIVDPAAAATW